MPKLDLDAAKERVEWSRQHMATGSASTLISHVLPAALAECEWSREMLKGAETLLRYKHSAWEAVGWLDALQKGPPDVA